MLSIYFFLLLLFHMLLKEFFIEIFDYFVVEENGEDEDVGFEGVEGH